MNAQGLLHELLGPMEAIQFLLFSSVAFSYTLYMAGFIPRASYLTLLALLVGVCLARLIASRCERLRQGPGSFHLTTVAIVALMAVFVGVTFIAEFRLLGTITPTSLWQSARYIAPALVGLAIATTVAPRVADLYVAVLVARYVLYMVLTNDLSITGLLSINWFQSFSPYESWYAHDLFVITIYFVARSRFVLAGLSAVFSMFAFKRLAFALTPLLFIFRKQIQLPTRPPIPLLIGTWVAVSLSPYVMFGVYSETFVNWMRDSTGLDIDILSSRRASLFNMTRPFAIDNPGFGWVDRQLFQQFGGEWGSTFHNDTIELYWEVGLLGLAGLAAAITIAARSSWASYIVVCYLFVEMVFSVTNFSFWFTVLLVLALMDSHSSRVGPSQGQRNGRTHALP